MGDLWPATKTGFALAEGDHQLDLPVERRKGVGLSVRRDTDALLWFLGGYELVIPKDIPPIGI